MSNEIKSGKEILDEFFMDITENETIDKVTVGEIVNLYEEGNLTVTSLSNALSDLRDAKDDSED